MAVEEEGIKSALEIAMERISSMPKLTPEEIAEHKGKEHRPIGEALCNKYMQGIIEAKSLLSELNQYRGEPERVVRKALVSCLCRSIHPKESAASVRAMEGLFSIAEDRENLREKANVSWMQIYEDYEQRKSALLKELESAARTNLANLGISGSAVLPNLNKEETSAQGFAALNREFDQKLEALRSLLLQ